MGLGFGSLYRPNSFVLGLRGNLAFVCNYILSLLVVALMWGVGALTLLSGEEEDELCSWTSV